MESKHIVDDPDNPALLRSRIEQQSDVIMLLKRNADAASLENKTMHSQLLKERLAARNAEEEVRKLTDALGVLDGRFSTLASQHQELIKFKDEYKDERNRLREQLKTCQKDFDERLEKEKASWESVRLTENQTLQHRIAELDSSIRKQSGELKQSEIEKKTISAAAVAADRAATAKRKDDAEQILELQRCVDALREDLVKAKGAMAPSGPSKDDMKSIASELEEAKSKLFASESNTKRAQEELKIAKSQIARLEKQLATQKKEAPATVPNDLTAQDQLVKVQREFAAYKKYSKELLQKEKQVNARLRTLQDV